MLVLVFAGFQFWIGHALTAYTPNLQLSHWLYTTVAVMLPWGISICFTGVMYSFSIPIRELRGTTTRRNGNSTVLS